MGLEAKKSRSKTQKSSQSLKSSKSKTKKSVTSTGTKGRGRKDGEGPTENAGSNQKLYIGVAAFLFLAAGGAVLLYVLLGAKTDSDSDCDKYLEEKASGVSTLKLDPIVASECIRRDCAFDFSQCKSSCPFGYESDETTTCTISCECAVKGTHQGDISFDERGLSNMLQEFGHVKQESEDFNLFYGGYKYNLWTEIEMDGRFKVPYELDGAMPQDRFPVWDKTVRNISERSCIDYIPRLNNEVDYIEISYLDVQCQSFVGKAGKRQLLKVPAGCFFESSLQHEMMHSLGFKHEQSRPDRDAYVDIFYDNIHESYVHNFDKEELRMVLDLKTEYEIESGMHYQSHYFSINKRKPTITGKGDKSIFYFPETHFLTALDFRELNLQYNCPERGETKTGEWQEWGSWSGCSATCDSGKKLRYRKCVGGGATLATGCVGLPSSFEDCNTQDCPPKTGHFLEWEPWTKCSKTCDKGYRMRLRHCSEILNCEGHYFDHGTCYKAYCDTGELITTETFGKWAEWFPIEKCSVSCGGGKVKQFRYCFHLEERMRPFRCPTDDLDPGVNEKGESKTAECNTQLCDGSAPPSSTPGTFPPPASTARPGITTPPGSATSSPGSTSPGSWPPTTVNIIAFDDDRFKPPNNWEAWSCCQKTCGKEMARRSRTCTAAENCRGQKESQITPCDLKPCPPARAFPMPEMFKRNLHAWGPWSNCDRTCGYAVKTRYRKCGAMEKDCEDGVLETKYCQRKPCDGEWSPRDASAGDSNVRIRSNANGCSETGENPDEGDTPGLGEGVGSISAISPGVGAVIGNGWPSVAATAAPGVFFPTLAATTAPSSESGSDGDGPAGSDSEGNDGGSLGGTGSGGRENGTKVLEQFTNGGLLGASAGNKLVGVCTYGYILVGRFNNDEVPDIGCIYSDGYLRLYFTDPQKGVFGERISWEGQINLCPYDVWKNAYNIYVADVDNNGLDDLICNNLNARRTEMTLNHGGQFATDGVVWIGVRGHCNWDARYFDINNDGKLDWICGDAGNQGGYVYFGVDRAPAGSQLPQASGNSTAQVLLPDSTAGPS